VIKTISSRKEKKGFDANNNLLSESKDDSKLNFIQTVDIKNDIEQIESIDVIDHDEIVRSDKRSIVFIIDFQIKGQRF
jgi:hypothetical protein